ncbi:hypothetical protein SLE2022_319480 [Rubroshorea leprosula]
MSRQFLFYPTPSSSPNLMSSSSHILILFVALFSQFYADYSEIIRGTAAYYDPPPHTPTACPVFNNKPLPSNGNFGAAGERLWENDAPCGRKYNVMCISKGAPTSCIPGSKKIEIVIIDRAKTSRTEPSKDDATVVLSIQSYRLIAYDFKTSVNVQIEPVQNLG